MPVLFQRVFQHLLPTGEAWRTTIVGKTLRKFVDGLSSWPADVRSFADAVLLDLFPSSTRQLAEWELQFGIEANPDEAVRRLNLAAEWAAGGGQSPKYLQDVLQTAGFDVYIHEWWSSGPPYVARDPRSYTTAPRIGTAQCSAITGAQPVCTGFAADGVPLNHQPECNAFLAGDPKYIVNKDLTERPPPRIPDDPSFWPYFLYIGGVNFGDIATLPLSRKDEFDRLILKIKPAQLWIVKLISWSGTTDGIFDATFDPTFN